MKTSIALFSSKASTYLTKEKIIGWAACIISLFGSYLLAMKSDYAAYGWVVFLISNIAWISWGIHKRAWELVVNHLGFSVTSGLGVYHWLFL